MLLRAILILAFTLIKFKILISPLFPELGGSKWGTQLLSIPTFLPVGLGETSPRKQKVGC